MREDFAQLDIIFNCDWRKIQGSYEPRKNLFDFIKKNLLLAKAREDINKRSFHQGLQL